MGKNNKKPAIEAIVVGTSQGGFQALKKILSPLPLDFPVPILAVRHQLPDSDDYMVQILNKECQLKVKFADSDEFPKPGNVYLAPPDRHMQLCKKGRLVLSDDEPVNFSRPSIDTLFISAAKQYGSSVMAVVLTGANSDSANGVIAIKKHGGQVIVQDPDSAEAPTMPRAAMAVVQVDHVVWLDQIGPLLWALTR